jgi:hypothetical protein
MYPLIIFSSIGEREVTFPALVRSVVKGIRMQATIVQRPVGQGGLLQSSLDCGGEPLRWIYDCGSNQVDSLNREIAVIAADPSIDILFLSHLDSDHINGVDRLLAAVSVKEVVLPYLREADLSFAICRDIEAGQLTGVFLDFATDPAGWLIGRGASTVTFVDGRSDDGPDDDGPDGTPETGGGGEGPIYYKWSREPVPIKNVGSSVVRRAASTSLVLAYTSGHRLDWVLVPYAFQPSVKLVKAFMRELRTHFDSNVSIKHIVSQARTKLGRDKLRLCYDALWANHNLVSMSLYAGPGNTQARQLEFHCKDGCYATSDDAVGWLSTGDAHLGGRKRRDALLKYYERFKPRVSVLVVPHHGAAEYFHQDLTRAFPNLRFAVASAGKNGYGHPHEIVKNAFKGWRPFFTVGDEESTRVLLRAHL